MAIGLMLVIAACASSPADLFTYAAQGVVVQAERLVGQLFERQVDPLPYRAPNIDQPLRRMHARFPELRAALEAGQIGLTDDGDVAVVGAESEASSALRHLVRAENRDRAVLYAAMSEAVGHEAYFVPYVDATFGREWQKQAPPGWWLRDAHGQWQAKP